MKDNLFSNQLFILMLHLRGLNFIYLRQFLFLDALILIGNELCIIYCNYCLIIHKNSVSLPECHKYYSHLFHKSIKVNYYTIMAWCFMFENKLKRDKKSSTEVCFCFVYI